MQCNLSFVDLMEETALDMAWVAQRLFKNLSGVILQVRWTRNTSVFYEVMCFLTVVSSYGFSFLVLAAPISSALLWCCWGRPSKLLRTSLFNWKPSSSTPGLIWLPAIVQLSMWNVLKIRRWYPSCTNDNSLAHHLPLFI